MKQIKKPNIVIAGILAIFLILSLVYLKITKQQTPKLNFTQCLDCNIVFVSFDSLRADHISVLGNERNTTPTLDKMAQKSFVFTNAISVAPWTLPSTMSWFTGLYPSQHGVLNKVFLTQEGTEKISHLKQTSPNTITLAEILQSSGYSTGGFTGGAGVHHQFGFDQGFDIYFDDKDFAGFEDTVPKALDWIRSHQNEKLFLFLHGYDIHGQFVPSTGYDYRFVDFDYQGNLTGSKEEQKELREEGIIRGQVFLSKEDVDFLTALYDEKIQRADEQFASFVAQYQRLGLMDKTIFILTSDHGEELYDHGRIDHGHSLNEELIKVPLIIIIPGLNKSVSINSQVRSIDLMPTILDLIGISPSISELQQISGQSLVPMMQGERGSLDVFPETDYRYATFQRSIRTQDKWKLIFDLETEFESLFNLNKDPQENNNLAETNKKILKELKNQLLNHIK